MLGQPEHPSHLVIRPRTLTSIPNYGLGENCVITDFRRRLGDYCKLAKKQFPKLLSLRKNNAITSSFGGAIITSFLFQALNNTARKITASNHLFVLTIN